MARSQHRATATCFIDPRTAQALGKHSLGAHRGGGGRQRRAEGRGQAGSGAQGGQLRGGRHGSHQVGVPAKVPQHVTAHSLSSALMHQDEARCVRRTPCSAKAGNAAAASIHLHGAGNGWWRWRHSRGWQQHAVDDVHDAAAGGDVGHGHAHGVDGAAHKDARCILDDGEALAACRPGRGCHQMRPCMISARMASSQIGSHPAACVSQ